MELRATAAAIRPERIRRLAALGVAGVIATDLVLRASGQAGLCRSCGDWSVHVSLLVAGLVAWVGFLVLEPRVPPAGGALMLGLLTGTHLALATYLLAIPRTCATCILACALSLLAFATLVVEGRRLAVAAGALLCAMAATHLAVAL